VKDTVGHINLFGMYKVNNKNNVVDFFARRNANTSVLVAA